ncbi:MAG TPA: lipocalin-like domain-containing protein [Longimicrobium sp.]|nr:lipocalin-like domain-containing protein [Longimicrobium sp.]
MSSPVEPRIKLSDLQKAIAGTWKLISAEDVVDGEWVPYTFGNPPSGYFIYNENGIASVQIMTTPPVTLTTPDTPTPDEAQQIFNKYIAYYGTWTADAVNITVQVEGAWDPSQVGTAQARPYQLDGDTLIIGDQVKYKRTLQRVV